MSRATVVIGALITASVIIGSALLLGDDPQPEWEGPTSTPRTPAAAPGVTPTTAPAVATREYSSPAAAREGFITGTLRDPDGVVLREGTVRIALERQEGQRLFATVERFEESVSLEGSRHFSIPVPARGSYRVTGQAPGLSPGSVKGVREGDRIDLTLGPLTVLQGKIVDDTTDAPVADALITITGEDGLEPQTAEADASGSFRVEGLAPGIVRWTATSSLHQTQGPRSVTINSGETVDLTIRLQAGKTVEGTVTAKDTGGPLPNTVVRVEGKTTQTDSLGRFAVHGLPHKMVNISVRNRAYLPQASSVNLAGSRTRVRRDFTLNPGATLFGLVSDRAGVPIADATLSVRLSWDADLRSSWSGHFPATDADIKTDAFGRYEVSGLAPSEGRWYFAELTLPGAPTARSRLVKLTTPRSRNRADIRLDGDRVVSGRVVTSQGQPVAEARVALSGQRENQSLVRATDGDGRFRFTQLSQDVFKVRVDAPGFAPRMRYNLDLKNADLTDFKITLSPTQVLKGRVLGPAGEPVPSAAISFGARGLKSDTTTGDDGRFIVKDLVRGPWTATVTCPGYGRWREKVAPQEDDAEFEIRLIKEAVLTGRVVNAVTGAPIERFRVSVIRRSSKTGRESRLSRSAKNDAEGRFTVQMPRVTGRLHVTATGHIPYESEPLVWDPAQPPRHLDIALVPAGEIEGVLTDRSGAALNRATVYLRLQDPDSPHFAQANATTEQDGYFHLGDLEPGVYEVAFKYAGHPLLIWDSVRVDGRGPTWITPSTRMDTEVKLEVRHGADAAGPSTPAHRSRPRSSSRGRQRRPSTKVTITSTTGQPLTMESVGRDPRKGRLYTPKAYMKTTVRGSRTITSLPAGQYRFVAKTKGERGISESLALERDSVRSLVFEYGRATEDSSAPPSPRGSR